MNDSNPLLQPHNLVNYAHIRLEHLKPAITRILDENRSAVELIISSQAQTPTWSGLVLAMDALSARVDDASNVLVTLALIPQTDDWQAIASECWTLISDWHVEVTQSLGLFKAYQTLATGLPRSDYRLPQRHYWRKRSTRLTPQASIWRTTKKQP